MPIEDFFTGDSIRPINLQNDEVIKEIIVPPRKPSFARYYKLRRRGAIDFPQLGVTLLAFPEDKEYRIVINAVGARPLRFNDLEAMLSEEKLTRSLVSDFAAKVVSRIKPLPNVYGSVDYRRKMAGLLIKKAFTEMGVVS
jgi:CO/xanthine dehydrogenase FAD-binding subunit